LAKQDARIAYAFVAPALLVVLVVVAVPIVWNIALSFQDLRLIELQDFNFFSTDVSLDNYRRVTSGGFLELLLRTFVYAIARNAAIDLQRRAASRPLATDEGDLGSAGPGDEPFDKLVLGLDVRSALQTLSDKHRQTLELAYDDDLTQRQIAERLGIPLGTVKTRSHHALRALRQELEVRGLV